MHINLLQNAKEANNSEVKLILTIDFICDIACISLHELDPL